MHVDGWIKSQQNKALAYYTPTKTKTLPYIRKTKEKKHLYSQSPTIQYQRKLWIIMGCAYGKYLEMERVNFHVLRLKIGWITFIFLCLIFVGDIRLI